MSKSILGKVAVGIAIAFCFFALTTASSAATVNVDFGEHGPVYAGTAAAPSSGTYWNLVNKGFSSNTTYGPFTADDGATATAVGIQLLRSAGYDNPTYPIANDLMSDYLYNASGANPVLGWTIGGLTPGGHYRLDIYSTNGIGAGATSAFTVQGVLHNVTNSGGVQSSFIEGNNYTLYSDVVANGSGLIIGSVAGAVGGTAWNGVQITEVPEPASLVLLATGLIGLLAYARGGKRG